MKSLFARQLIRVIDHSYRQIFKTVPGNMIIMIITYDNRINNIIIMIIIYYKQRNQLNTFIIIIISFFRRIFIFLFFQRMQFSFRFELHSII